MSRSDRWLIRNISVLVAVALWMTLLLRQAGGFWWLGFGPIAVLGLVHLSRTVATDFRPPGFSLVLIAPLVLGVGHATVSGGGNPATASGDWLTSLGGSLRAQLHTHAAGVSRDAIALTLGITDGDTSMISDSLKQQFKLLSLTHLTAVSGTNCAILIGVTLLALNRIGLRRAYRTAISLAVLGSYLVLVGNQPSVVRAALMSAVALLALSMGNRVRTLNVFALAVAIGLVVEPDFAADLGFQLSVAATAGVVFLAPMLAKRLPNMLPNALRLALAVTLAAQLVCLPILISLQSTTSVGAILANLVAEPAVVPATILGLVAAALSLLHLGLPAEVAFSLASLPSAFLVGMSGLIIRYVPSLGLPSGLWGQVWACSVLLATCLWAWDSKRLKLVQVASAMVAVFSLVAVALPRFPGGTFAPPGWVMVACDVGQGDATIIQAAGRFALVDTGKYPSKILACLSRLGIRKLDVLVLTHFDLDHVGAVSQVLADVRVKQALLTQFPDVRPGAKLVQRLLLRARVPVRELAIGDTGSLGPAGSPGQFEWLVLTPHPGGADSIDSNDGSVAMFWHSKNVNIFTMADLPASGQRRVMDERAMWWDDRYRRIPTILKVSHHGSADQDPEFLAWVAPLVSTISVGLGNDYGHPTQKTLAWLKRYSRATLRTDQLGSISLTSLSGGRIAWAWTGAG